jgi:hypothetical protein
MLAASATVQLLGYSSRVVCADLSTVPVSVQVARARKHWHGLRAEMQSQVQQWTNIGQNLPDLPALWDVIAVDQDGVQLSVLPAKCRRCAQATVDAPQQMTVAVAQNDKENAQNEAVKALTHKLAIFASIIDRRRSFAKGQKVSAPSDGCGAHKQSLLVP